MIGAHISPGGLHSPSDGVDAGAVCVSFSARYSQRQTSSSSPFLSPENCLKLFTSRSLAATAAAISPSPPHAADQSGEALAPHSAYTRSAINYSVEPSAAYAFPYACASDFPVTPSRRHEQVSPDAVKEGRYAEYPQQQQQLLHQQEQQWHRLQRQQLGESQHRLQQRPQEQQQPQGVNYCFDSYPADALTWKGRSGIRSGLTPVRRGRSKTGAAHSPPVSGLVTEHQDADNDPQKERLPHAAKDVSCGKFEQQQQPSSQQQRLSHQQRQVKERLRRPLQQHQQLQQQPQQQQTVEEQQLGQNAQEQHRHGERGVQPQQQQRVEQNSDGKTEGQEQGAQDSDGASSHVEHGSADGIMSRFEPVYVQRNVAGAAAAPIVSPAGTSIRPAAVDTSYNKLRGAAAAAGLPSVKPPRLSLAASAAGTAKTAAAARAAAAGDCTTGPFTTSPFGGRGPPLKPALRPPWNSQQQQQQQQQLPQQQVSQREERQHLQQQDDLWVNSELRDGCSGAAGRESVPDLNNTRTFQRLLRSFPPPPPPPCPPISRQRRQQPGACRAPRAAPTTGSVAACSSGPDVDAGLQQKPPPVRRYLWHDKRVLEQLGLPLSRAELFRYAKGLEEMYASECTCLLQRRSAAAAALSRPPRGQTAAANGVDAVAVPRWMLDYGVHDPALDKEGGREATSTRRGKTRAAATRPAAAGAAAAPAPGKAPPTRGMRSADGRGKRAEPTPQYYDGAGDYFYLYPAAEGSSGAGAHSPLAADTEQQRRFRAAVAALPAWEKDSSPFLPSEELRSGTGAAHLNVSPFAAARRAYLAPSAFSCTAAAPQGDCRYYPRDRFCSVSYSPWPPGSFPVGAPAAPLSSPSRPSVPAPSSSSRPPPAIHFCQGLDTTGAEAAPPVRHICSCCSAAARPPYCLCCGHRIAPAAAGYPMPADAAVTAPLPRPGGRGPVSPVQAGQELQQSKEDAEDSFFQRSRNASQTSSSSAQTTFSASTSAACRSAVKQVLLADPSYCSSSQQRRRRSTNSQDFPLSPSAHCAATPAARAGVRRTRPPQQQLQQLSEQVWTCPRIAALLCSFLPLPQLLQVRRCSKQLLVAAQYEMRYILYATLQQLLLQQTKEKEVKGRSNSSRRRSSVSSALHVPQNPRRRSSSAGAETPAFPSAATSSASPGQQTQQRRDHMRETSSRREQSLPSCPFAADTLIRLLQVKTDVLELLKKGALPPRRAIDAGSPREQEVRAAAAELKRFSALARQRREQHRRWGGGQHRRGRREAGEAAAAAAYTEEEEEKEREASEIKALEEEVLLRRAMQLQWQQELLQREQRLQQQEHTLFFKEEQLRLQQREQQRQRVGLRGRAAAGLPAAGQGNYPYCWTRPVPRAERAEVALFEDEPPVFRRLRHAFLKLWNYNEDVFKSALYRSAFASFPPYSHDAVAILCRCIYQLCVDSSACVSLNSILLLLVDRRSYVWQRMAHLSGYWLSAGGSEGAAPRSTDGSGRTTHSLSTPPQHLQAVPLQQLLAVANAASGAAAVPHSRGRFSTTAEAGGEPAAQRSSREDWRANATAAATRRSTVRRQRDSSVPCRWQWRDVDEGAGGDEIMDRESERRKMHVAAGRSFGVRPSVRGSVEMKLAKLPDGFIDAFLLYGQQQALAHQEACWAASSNGVSFPEGKASRRGKTYDSGHVLLDMYEWVAAVLTFLAFWDRCVPRWASAAPASPATPATATRSSDAKCGRIRRSTGAAARAEGSASRTPYYASSGVPPAVKTLHQSVDKERSAAAVMPCNRGRSRGPAARASSTSVHQRTASQKTSCSLRDATALCKLLQNQALILEDVKLILKHLAKQV